MSKNYKSTLTHEELNNLSTNGTRGVSDLAKMAEALGYGYGVNQLLLNNGCFVSSILNFFEDNPGAIEAVYDWVREYYEDQLEANQEEEDCDEDE